MLAIYEATGRAKGMKSKLEYYFLHGGDARMVNGLSYKQCERVSGTTLTPIREQLNERNSYVVHTANWDYTNKKWENGHAVCVDSIKGSQCTVRQRGKARHNIEKAALFSTHEDY